MSGHSKWSKVKHQKAATDTAKSSAFTRVSRAITIAVAEGGGVTDPAGNFKLRLAIDNARSVNMPKETIARAIERARVTRGDIGQYLYEGYGPGGVAYLVEVNTDNKQRIAAQVKHLFESFGGSLAGPGSTIYLFRTVGEITIPQKLNDRIFELSINAGAQDVVGGDGECIVYTKDTELNIIAGKLVEDHIPIASRRIIYQPSDRIKPEASLNEKAIKLLDSLKELDDVRNVYSNI